MNYAELSATQYRRAREFSKAHTDVMAMYCDAERDLKESQAENDRLRELVSILAHCAADSGCDSCPINGGCARVGELDLCETVHDHMRELGVDG